MPLQPLARLKIAVACFTPASNSFSMPGLTSICAISMIMACPPLCDCVFAAAEETVLGVVGGGVAHRFDGADLGECALDAGARGNRFHPFLDVRARLQAHGQKVDIAQPRKR